MKASLFVLDDMLNSFDKYCSCPKEFIINWISTECERWSNDAQFLNVHGVHGDTQYGLLISGSLVNMMVFWINNVIWDRDVVLNLMIFFSKDEKVESNRQVNPTKLLYWLAEITNTCFIAQTTRILIIKRYNFACVLCGWLFWPWIC